MPKDNKISIKLEVCRDKTSNKLIITAHFDSKADNIFIDKDSYAWMPTIEERDLLNDAFTFFPTDGAVGSLGKTTIKTPDEEEPISEPMIEEPSLPLQEETVKEDKPSELLPLENPAEAGVFQKTDEEPKIDEIDNQTVPNADEQPKDETSGDEKKDKDEALLVEADGDAIERALKKHANSDEDKDASMVEVDEQMIIDKVLSQKKKGKWAKK